MNAYEIHVQKGCITIIFDLRERERERERKVMYGEAEKKGVLDRDRSEYE